MRRALEAIGSLIPARFAFALRRAKSPRAIERSEQAEDDAPDRYVEQREKWSFWARALTRGPEDLRAILGLDEVGYRMVAGPAHAQARHYFLYATLDEIEKLGIAVMSWDEILGIQDVAVDDAVTRVILERSLNEQSFWLRKTIEVLVDLVLFSTTNEDPYYRHLLLLRDLRRHLSIQQDLEAFYGAPSNNVAWSINRVYEDIREIEGNEIDFGRVWYAQHQGQLQAVPRLNGILTSVRQRLRLALPHMHAHEKLSAGLSYARIYGTTSEDIHFRPAATLQEISSDAVALGIDRVAIDGIAALKRVQELLDQVPAGVNEKIRDSFEANDFPAQVLDQQTRDRADVGDFVLEGVYLGEVLETRESAFGYHVYRVGYLAERALPDVGEDWVLAEHLRRFYTREEFLRRTRESVEAGTLPPDAIERFEARPVEAQQDIVRESLLHTWEHGGLREWARGQN